MNKKTVSILTFAMLGALSATAQQKTALSYWFDTPVTLKGQQVWYGGHPEKWTHKKPISAGDTARNRIRIGSLSHCLSVMEVLVPISWDR